MPLARAAGPDQHRLQHLRLDRARRRARRCSGCSPPGISRLTALFFAAMLGANTEARLNALTRGCVIGGVIASLAAIIGYFRIFPSLNELLLLYDRARGTFKDPNVLGAFLIFPALLALQPVICRQLPAGGQGRDAARPVRAGDPAVVLARRLGPDRLHRARRAGADLHHHALAAAAAADRAAQRHRRRRAGAASSRRCCRSTSSPTCSSSAPASSRATTSASRAASRATSLGAVLALDMPFGIGPLQFSKYFPEDPHNSYLNAFMSGGWLAGACYPTLVAAHAGVRLARGVRPHALAADHHRGVRRAISASRPKASSSTPTTGGTRSCCSA